MTPAEQALAELVDTLASCDHMRVPEASVLVACIQCELSTLVDAVRPLIAAQALRDAAAALDWGDDASEGHVSGVASAFAQLCERADQIERGAV